MKAKVANGFLSGLFIIAVLISSAGAEDGLTIDKTVVTATRTESTIKDVPASVEIVTAEEIKNMEGATVTDVLRYSIGIDFYSSMFRATPSIRGFEGKHTLLLIDGRRISGPMGKYNETDRMTTENIERIEIIRGPMSTLYGSEAMGGVINIITKKPDKISVAAGAKYGGYGSDADTSEAYFDLSLGGDKLGKFGFSLSGQTINSNPLMNDENETLSQDKELSSISSKLTYRFTDELSSEITLGFTDDSVNNRFFSTYLRSSDNEYERVDASIGVDYKASNLQAMVRGYYSDWNKEYETRYAEDYTSRGTLHPAGELKDFDSGERTTTVLEGHISKLLFENHLFTFGGECRREFYRSARNDTGEGNFTETREGVTIEGSEYEPDNYALYLQDEWSVGDKLLIIPGIRYDEPEGFDSEISPKLGITWFIHPNMRMKANYGHSYATPGTGQLFKDWYGMGGRYHILGNKDLKPEVSDSYEIAFEGEKGKLGGRIAYFFNDVTDLIDMVEIGNEGPRTTVYQYANINEAEIQGAEVEMDYRITDSLSFTAGYTHIDAKDKDTDERLEQRPKNKIIAKLFYSNRKHDFDVNIWGEHTADYLQEEENYSYTVCNINFKKRLFEKYELYAGVENFFDEKEEDLHDRVLGAYYYGGVNVKF